MEKHYQEDLAVADMAQFVEVSPARFSETFKQETGLPPADYFRRFKCLKAREFLSQSSIPITEIAFHLGFSSSQYFANVFRKYTGMSPGTYRKMHTSSIK